MRKWVDQFNNDIIADINLKAKELYINQSENVAQVCKILPVNV